jgi:hypothetical protein
MHLLRQSTAGSPRTLAAVLTAIIFVGGTLTPGASRGYSQVSPQSAALFDVVTTAQATLLGPATEAHMSGNGSPGDFASSIRAHAVVLGDFNGDGIQDIAVGAPDFAPTITPPGGQT